MPRGTSSCLVGVFDPILDTEFGNDISTFDETFMGAMLTHNPRMTPKVYLLVHYVPEYVRRTGVQFGPTSIFDIFYHRFKVNCAKSPVFRERLLNTL